jgi:ANTAR domain-containing protein
MERYKITPEQAFDLLIAASQHTHRKLYDIAGHLSATGELPTD